MRTIIVFSSAVLLATVGSAAAQTTYVGPWQPRPMMGGAFGAFAAGNQAGGARLLLSGTLEVPFSDNGRFRIEGGRGTIPVTLIDAADPSVRFDMARVSRLTIGVAGLHRPGAPVSGYAGAGVGLYRARVEKGPTLPVTVGVNLYGGLEFMVSEQVSLDAEFGLHLLDENLLNDRLFGEAVIRLKVGL